MDVMKSLKTKAHGCHEVLKKVIDESHILEFSVLLTLKTIDPNSFLITSLFNPRPPEPATVFLEYGGQQV